MKSENQNPAQTSSKSSVDEHNEDNIFNESDVVFRYTRAQAIADGVLVDVSNVAHEAGFKLPVVLTQAVWADCVAWVDGNKPQAGQDEAGRLWDVLWMAMNACRTSGDDQYKRFQLYRVKAKGKGIQPKLVTLVMHIGPGDNAEPVITIMRPGED